MQLAVSPPPAQGPAHQPSDNQKKMTISAAVSRIVNKDVLELLQEITQDLSNYRAHGRRERVRECMRQRDFLECLSMLNIKSERDSNMQPTLRCWKVPSQDVVDKCAELIHNRIMSLYTKVELEHMIQENMRDIEDMQEDVKDVASIDVSQARVFRKQIHNMRAQNADYKAELKRRG